MSSSSAVDAAAANDSNNNVGGEEVNEVAAELDEGSSSNYDSVDEDDEYISSDTEMAPASDDYKEQARAIVAVNPTMARVPYCDPSVDLERFSHIISTRYNGEFAWSGCFEGDFLASVAYYGFLPMSTTTGNQYMLLPKLHTERCIMQFRDLHIPKKMKKLAKRFELTIDQSFDEVVEQINLQHGKHSWFYPPLVAGYRTIFDRNNTTATLNGLVRLHTIELRQNGKLVAGEVGYTCGAAYTSLSGFKTVNSSGTVQCVLLGILLERCGFSFWDLGMSMDYKLDLGAKNVPRKAFLSMLTACRDNTGIKLQLDQATNPILGENGGEILRQYKASHQVAVPPPGGVNTEDTPEMRTPEGDTVDSSSTDPPAPPADESVETSGGDP